MIRPIIGLLICLFILACQQEPLSSSPESAVSSKKRMETLPLIDASFNEIPSNWSHVKTIKSNPFHSSKFEMQEGNGIVVCHTNGKHLNTGIDHEDIELDLEFMIPKGSNSGIYFQGRYELQIFDSWGKSELSNQDCGAIRESYFEKEKAVFHKGATPKVNASKAPGLWQSFNILFRAPRFDADGNKVSNAKFEHVYHNGFLIHENIEIPLPTRTNILDGETSFGPIMFQGDHGQVAFRNIKYKKLGPDTVGISNITYKMYDQKMDYIPDFDTMSVTKTGVTKNFDKLEELAGQQDGFAFIFNAEIIIPKDGDYLFTTVIDDGGDLFIDDKLIVHNLGEPGIGTETGLVTLSKGMHKLKLTYFEEVWLALANIYVEGPEMPKKTLAAPNMMKLQNSRSNKDNILVNADKDVEILRGYITHGDTKETHALSVGDPAEVHYSYDLMDATILKAWKGKFADVTNMWKNRGHSQLLLARNAVVEFEDGVPFASLTSNAAIWPKERPNNFKNKGYRLNGFGRPTFLSSLGNAEIEDSIFPSADGHLKRETKVINASDESVWLNAAAASSIEEIDNRLINVNSEYYIKLSPDVKYHIKSSNSSNDRLLISLENVASYEIIW